MGKTSNAVKRRYRAKVYDQLNITIPKGRKEIMQAAASARGESMAEFLQRAALDRMGLAEWPELPTEAESDED